MASQIFEIRELVELICEALLTYYPDAESGHIGLKLHHGYPHCLKVLAVLARVNKFIGSIASTVLWREPTKGLKPFLRVFPDDYVFTTAERGMSIKKVSNHRFQTPGTPLTSNDDLCSEARTTSYGWRF